jgi:hypothetical protein
MRFMAALGLFCCFHTAHTGNAQTLSTYGTPGLIDLPTAEVFSDGELALTTSFFGNNQRNTATFQVLPRLYGTFRYSIIRDFDPGGPQGGDRFDRSFDLHYQIAEETDRRPAFGIGLRDFGGTGIFSSEYIVATKTFGATGNLKITGGLGWGRLAERGTFSNPLGVLSDRFDSRPGQVNNTGQLDSGAWFRGPAALFGGVEYQASDRLSFQLEYSSDTYSREASVGIIDIKTPINVGLNYSFPSGSSVRAFVIGGSEVGLQYSFTLDPAKRRSPGGLENAPLPIVPQKQAVLTSWGLAESATRTQTQSSLKALLADEGIELQGFIVNGSEATIRVDNKRWDVEAQAAGRAARAMARVLPRNIDSFVVTFLARGVAISSIQINRSDFEGLEADFDGAWKSLTRTQITDAAATSREGELPEVFPKFTYGLTPYTAFSFFDPDSPIRADAGLQFAAQYLPRPGLAFTGVFRYPVVGNIDDATRLSNSVLPRVRTDAGLFAQQSDFEINELTVERTLRPGKNLFGRVTGGYLENNFGGISAELLWYPIDSRLALGAEINYVRQRDFDMLLGVQDYSVVTGHASAYLDHGNGFVSQLDVGRYLARDWGATYSLDREFNNGFKIGGFFTLTNVSFDDFGEGSFDKGLRVSIPLSWLTGKPSRDVINQVIQPVQRDGGARLNVSNRLYGVTRDYRAEQLGEGWGRFYR